MKWKNTHRERFKLSWKYSCSVYWPTNSNNNKLTIDVNTWHWPFYATGCLNYVSVKNFEFVLFLLTVPTNQPIKCGIIHGNKVETIHIEWYIGLASIENAQIVVNKPRPHWIAKCVSSKTQQKCFLLSKRQTDLLFELRFSVIHIGIAIAQVKMFVVFSTPKLTIDPYTSFSSI